MEIKKVGVVGCGIMGAGIAETCAKAGYPVIVSEVNQQLLDKGMATINNSLSKAVDRGKITDADKAAAIGNIKTTTNMEDFKDCDLVIEAIIEKLDLKKKIFADLDRICPAQAILATNTSCLSVIEMAAATKRLDKVMGLHFFNPVPVMKLLELVKTISTSDETLSAARVFGQAIGKVVIVAPDAPGFIVNRLLCSLQAEAVRMVETGIATKEDLDQGAVLGLNHPMGPLSLLDLVGIDTALEVMNYMYDELKEPKFAPPVLIKKMVAAGQYGRKSGKGFYDYKK